MVEEKVRMFCFKILLERVEHNYYTGEVTEEIGKDTAGLS